MAMASLHSPGGSDLSSLEEGLAETQPGRRSLKTSTLCFLGQALASSLLTTSLVAVLSTGLQLRHYDRLHSRETRKGKQGCPPAVKRGVRTEKLHIGRGKVWVQGPELCQHDMVGNTEVTPNTAS